MLTFKIAKRTDIWLHTKDIPGSHVVIHMSEPDETTLREAATLAAYFSKARESSSVPVDYTEIRQVKKPNGAKPGFVIYFEQKTLYIDPDEAVILQLKNNHKLGVEIQDDLCKLICLVEKLFTRTKLKLYVQNSTIVSQITTTKLYFRTE